MHVVTGNSFGQIRSLAWLRSLFTASTWWGRACRAKPWRKACSNELDIPCGAPWYKVEVGLEVEVDVEVEVEVEVGIEFEVEVGLAVEVEFEVGV